MRLKKRAVTIAATLCSALLAGQLMAHEYQIADLHIDHPWSRALPPAAKAGAAYLTIDNRGEQAERLLQVSTPIAANAEMHEHIHQDGLMKMQQVDTLLLPAGNSISFKPGSYHIMLFDLKQPLVAGERFPLTLHFEQAGELEVEVSVQQDEPLEDEAEHPAAGEHLHH